VRPTSLTIAYLTHREHPRFEWFCSSLARQFRESRVDRASVQVLVIDGRLWYDETRAETMREVGSLYGVQFEHHPPKPSVWQGPHRLTQRNYFAASSTRNTAFARARGSHVAFVDDLSVLLPGWLQAHLEAARAGYVLCGTTCKHKNIVVNDVGGVVTYGEHSTDSRLKHFDGDAPVRCSGGWLYGGTFSVPLEHALRVNGQDEIADSVGGEDYDFGERLERAGSAVYISRKCGTFEDEDGHHNQAAMVRLDKPWPPDPGGTPRLLTPSGWTVQETEANAADGPYSSNCIQSRMRREGRTWTAGNAYNLRELRDRVLAGEPFPIPTEPTHHWVDGQPLSEM